MTLCLNAILILLAVLVGIILGYRSTELDDRMILDENQAQIESRTEPLPTLP